MALKKINPIETKAWRKLQEHYQDIKEKKMVDMFCEDDARVDKFHIKWDKFYLDYSKNRLDDTTKKLLVELCEEVDLKDAIQKQFKGEIINVTENRAVAHTRLRAQEKPNEVEAALEKMKVFSEKLIDGDWKGATGKSINHVVNIGVGGSDLGSQMVLDALEAYQNQLKVHFVSNIDGDHVLEVLKKIEVEQTIFIVVSKSFSTQETLSNATTIKKWFLEKGFTEKDIHKHFVAVSACNEKAVNFGILEENIFPMWDWVGGRFSLWSAVGLSICCGIGYKNFTEMLQGAQKMDEHFENTSFDENIPVLLALISIWYNNFFLTETEAVIPYSQYLQKFIPYLQQGVMESNGKNIDRNGKKVTYQTGNVIWGEPGTNAQHAFFQLIHQGTKLVPCDFIGFNNSVHGNKEHHHKLMANFFAQTEAFLCGKSQAKIEEEIKDLSPEEQERIRAYKCFEGNKPTNTLLIERLNPETLGSLIALYEHKLFVQGVIWNIYSYDQWGVELGKQLASKIYQQLETGKVDANLDASTQQLLKEFLSK
ncbi:glucose-6-phosphate isomerase [Mesonia ostreae]|uniref:Glucose-6-phosphate isomerase n=1 Tax=Mesonia ostreae TaxID=861110 RepID=A0ABU2KGH9_9FLAO|nr:glucose-6-phosphate isomerase [Mesonia ostreae]MDT0293810.1 glucose-6-phosphate isomerase [Mesonia ostreae]